MKIFTEKAFENCLAQERERMERDRYIMDRMDSLKRELNELARRVSALEDNANCKTPSCEEVLKCEGR